MDLETENRIAAILMKEAAELRRQAEKEGVHVYLQQPKPRVRPNPRFLAATVLGVQQGYFFFLPSIINFGVWHRKEFHFDFIRIVNIKLESLFD